MNFHTLRAGVVLTSASSLASAGPSDTRVRNNSREDGCCFISRASLFSYAKDRARQEQLARDRIAAMKSRRAAAKAKSEEEAQKELEEKLLKEQAEDSETDKRNALDMEQGGLALLQEAILTEVEKKHSSEQEVRFNKAYLTKWFSFCFIVWSCRNLIGLNRS